MFTEQEASGGSGARPGSVKRPGEWAPVSLDEDPPTGRLQSQGPSAKPRLGLGRVGPWLAGSMGVYRVACEQKEGPCGSRLQREVRKPEEYPFCLCWPQNLPPSAFLDPGPSSSDTGLAVM